MKVNFNEKEFQVSANKSDFCAVICFKNCRIVRHYFVEGRELPIILEKIEGDESVDEFRVFKACSKYIDTTIAYESE
ncbi:hypothetical protein [Peromfec virus RodF8_19]|uniref:Uncharacterized protein n=1 Tax=Peromfec virus RodF8_19 TaxID=2929361 RepID=A0A976N2Q8_9VIRU|nr:hypothetical protein [Peromfec virus RodF8_19]